MNVVKVTTPFPIAAGRKETAWRTRQTRYNESKYFAGRGVSSMKKHLVGEVSLDMVLFLREQVLKSTMYFVFLEEELPTR